MEQKRNYIAYEIVGNGWRYNLSSFKTANIEWLNGAGNVFYGVKEDGTREEIARR